jgi:hypothetical protein
MLGRCTAYLASALQCLYRPDRATSGGVPYLKGFSL